METKYSSLKVGQSWTAQVVTPANQASIVVAKVAPTAYKLTKSLSNATCSVFRNGVELENNADIYPGDALVVGPAVIPEGFELTVALINTEVNIPISGTVTYYVNGATSVEVTAEEVIT